MHAAFLHDTMFGVVFFFLFRQSLIQHPHWCICRSAVNTLASLSLSVSVFSAWRLKTCLPVRVRPTDCLTSSLVCAMQFWLNVSPLSLFPHIGLFDVIRLLFIFWHPRPSCCSRRRCSACKYLCAPPPPHTHTHTHTLSTLLSCHPSIWSQANCGDAICAKDCLSSPSFLY